MRFCTTCGKTISILNDSGADLCQSCKTPAPKSSPHNEPPPNTVDLSSTKLSVKNGKLILESEEGWLLWSGDKLQQHSMGTITERASRILKIRKRQQEK